MASTASELIIRRFVGGPLLTTSYALISPGNETVIIDAPRDAWRGGFEAAKTHDAPVSLAIATHGHWDHITDLSRIREAGVPIAGHLADEYLFSAPMSYRRQIPYQIEPVPIDVPLEEGQQLEIGSVELRILHTPGHTHGSVSIWVADSDALFTGDTVLKGGAGYLEREECDPEARAGGGGRRADDHWPGGMACSGRRPGAAHRILAIRRKPLDAALVRQLLAGG